MADPADVMFHDPAVIPGTHALVIGIGQYPHLGGGDAPAKTTDGLNQISSPPISARAMANWLLYDYRCPGKELASLALLTSEPASAPFDDPRTGVGRDVATADIAAIVTAVKEWKRRGDTSADNRLIFYFCGHGISEGNDMALLAREFSLDDDNPLNNALDFPKLVDGLRKCQASQQIFLVDACRASSDVLISQTGGLFAGQVPLLGGRRPLELPRLEAMTYYATLAGDLSHARPNSVSLFTEATLRAFRGAGSDNPNEEDWLVNTSRLHEAVDHFMKQPVFAGKVAGVQIPAVNEMPVFDLHQLTGLPIVPVYVGCVPQEENETAEFVCRQGGAEKFRRAVGDLNPPEDPTGPWVLDLTFGEYEFEARLAPNDVRVRSRNIRPLKRDVELRRTP
jgi:hypothetical protein